MPAGLPRKEPEIPVAKIKELAEVGCTDEEIGIICGLDDATIARNFAPLLKEGRANMRQSIRHSRLQRARDGSDTMLIWLGKCVLHQKEKTDVVVETGNTLAEFIQSIRHSRTPN